MHPHQQMLLYAALTAVQKQQEEAKASVIVDADYSALEDRIIAFEDDRAARGIKIHLAIIDDETPLDMIDALQKFDAILESNKDPNGPAAIAHRERQVILDANGGYPPSIPIFARRIIKPLTWQPKIYDDQTYMHRERKNTGARKQQRAAKARRRRK